MGLKSRVYLIFSVRSTMTKCRNTTNITKSSVVTKTAVNYIADLLPHSDSNKRFSLSRNHKHGALQDRWAGWFRTLGGRIGSACW